MFTIKQATISPEQEKFCYNLKPELTIAGSFCTHFLTIWRGQFCSICKELGIKESKIQTLETAKLQSKLLNTLDPVRMYMALVAIKDTLLLDAELYVKAENKQLFMEENVKQMCEPGEAKILAREQIHTEKDIIITRRGVMARLRGTIQATGLFNPSSLISGTSITTISFQEFVESYISYSKSVFSLSPKELLEIFQKLCSDYGVSISDSEVPKDLSDIINQLTYLGKSLIEEAIFEDKIEIADGIDMRRPSNILPLEGVFNITRLEPRRLEKIEIARDTVDPVLKEILAQQTKLIVDEPETKGKKKTGRKK